MFGAATVGTLLRTIIEFPRRLASTSLVGLEAHPSHHSADGFLQPGHALLSRRGDACINGQHILVDFACMDGIDGVRQLAAVEEDLVRGCAHVIHEVGERLLRLVHSAPHEVLSQLLRQRAQKVHLLLAFTGEDPVHGLVVLQEVRVLQHA